MSDQWPASSDIVTRTSTGSVAECLDRLRLALKARDLTIFAEFDHSGEARARGLELRETQVVVFGNPLTGTLAMQGVALAALDLPLQGADLRRRRNHQLWPPLRGRTESAIRHPWRTRRVTPGYRRDRGSSNSRLGHGATRSRANRNHVLSALAFGPTSPRERCGESSALSD